MSPISDDKLYGFMTDNHRSLNELFGRVLDAHEVDSPDARALWSELDRCLASHMEAEERFVLPAFARVDPDEALALQRQHDSIRKQLFELGIAVDMHFIRLEPCRRFIETLRAHIDREHRLLDRWADQRIDLRPDSGRRRVATR